MECGIIWLGNERKEEGGMKLKGKKVILLAENNYEDMELWVPYYRLKEEGAEVRWDGKQQDLQQQTWISCRSE
jgi:hypothetical protein